MLTNEEIRDPTQSERMQLARAVCYAHQYADTDYIRSCNYE